MHTKSRRRIMMAGLIRIHGGDTRLENVPMPTPHHPKATNWIDLVDAYLDMDGLQANSDEELQDIVDRIVARELAHRPVVPKGFIGPLSGTQTSLIDIDKALEELKRMQDRDFFKRYGPTPPMRVDKKVITPGHSIMRPDGTVVYIEEEFEWVDPPRPVRPPRRRRRRKVEEPLEFIGPSAIERLQETADRIRALRGK